MDMDANVGRFLQRAFASGQTAHAYIVVGDGKRLPALLNECAAVTMCPSHLGDDGCIVCNKVADNASQDVMRLPSGKRMAVSDVEYLVDESFKRPVDSREQRVFLIDASESCAGAGAEAWQNKLLKTLEEPTDNVYIFIGVTDPEGLLPTVRSRCQILRQDRLGVAQIKNKLLSDGFTVRSAEIASAMCGGSLPAAYGILADSNVFGAYETAIDVAANMLSTKSAANYLDKITACKDNFNDFLGFWSMLLRESIVVRLSEGLSCLPSLANTIDKICENYTLAACENCIELLNNAKKQCDDGVSFNAVVDRLLINILETRYQCRK